MGDTYRQRKNVRTIIRELEKYLGVPSQNNGMTPPDPLDMLIATLLSQHTNDTNSYRAYTNLKRKFPTYEAILNARTSSIESAIRVGGLAKQKARRIQSLLKTIRTKYGTFHLEHLRDKSDEEIMHELTSFKGIGLKTAACVLLFSLGRNCFPVDTHVHRVLNRIGIVKTPTPEKTFYLMENLVPPEKMYSFHTNLIRFGRSVCTSRDPSCFECPLRTYCLYGQSTIGKGRNKIRKARNDERRDFMLLDSIAGVQHVPTHPPSGVKPPESRLRV